MIAVQLSMLIVGIVIAYWLDYGMSLKVTSVQWRLPIAFQAVLAFVLIAMCLLLPGKSLATFAVKIEISTNTGTESPRWLVSHGHPDEAIQVLCILRNGNPNDHNRLEFTEIENAIALEAAETGSWKDVFSDGGIMG
jgi:hypothetical protein